MRLRLANRSIAVASLLVIVFLMAAGCGMARRGEGDEMIVTVTFIDVGKGDCILIEKGDAVMLIDTGYKDTAKDVTTFLKARDISHLDVMMITHYDKDHVGGAAQIAEAFDIGQIYLPDYVPENSHYESLMDVIAARGLRAQRVSEDVSFTLAEVEYTIYASPIAYDPDDGGEGNDNDVSLVVSAIYGEDSYLFAGDLEKKGIKAYLAAEHGAFDVVKMPHHGRRESNSDDFIESVQPKIAVVTDSEDDPAEEKLLDELAEAGVSVYRSAECGSIAVSSRGEGTYAVTTER